MQQLIRSVDPVTFEILSHRLHQITKEMAIALERTGGTVNTTQQRDYMTSLYRPDGEILSAGETMGDRSLGARSSRRRPALHARPPRRASRRRSALVPAARTSSK